MKVARALLLSLLLAAPAIARAQEAPVRLAALHMASDSDDEIQDAPAINHRLLAIGVGAVAGVAAFNLLAAPIATVPLAGGALAAVPQSVALGSRLIAVTTAGAGALAATWLYDEWTGHQSDYAYLVSLGAGALAGVAVGNVIGAGILGVPPYFVGAGEAAAGGVLSSPAAQAASRVYVIASGVVGAWAADWFYHRPSATP